MPKKDCDGICLLLRECDGKVYQWKRFKIGIYALSEGRIDNLGLEKIFSYMFEEFCYVGPADSELESDIASMVMTDYIDKERVRHPNDKTDHEQIYLLERGIKVANNFEKELSKRQIESVIAVAKSLKNEGNNVEDLLNMYCKTWRQMAIKELEKVLPSKIEV